MSSQEFYFYFGRIHDYTRFSKFSVFERNTTSLILYVLQVNFPKLCIYLNSNENESIVRICGVFYVSKK